MNRSQEFSRRALDLSLAIYRVTANFPANEVLVWQMRKPANEIAAELDSVETGDIERVKKNISRLRIYFQIAKAQNWVNPINWSILDFEYYKLGQEVLFELGEHGLEQKKGDRGLSGEKKAGNITSHNIEDKEKAERQAATPSRLGSQSCRERILSVLDKSQGRKMSDLTPLFKEEVSERTLRNNLNKMVGAGLVKRKGVNKFSEYYKT